MLIAFEGPDGGGKTTLINRFRVHHPEFQYTKPVPEEGPKGQTEEYMVRTTKELFQRVKNGENFVSDRLNFLSEEVYGPICRNGSILSTRSFNELLFEYQDEVDPLLIYCRPSNPTIINNVNKNFQMDGVKQNIDKIIQAYDILMHALNNCGIDYYVYDYEKDPDATQVLFYLESEISRRRDQNLAEKFIEEEGAETPKEVYELVGDPYTCLVEECAELIVECNQLTINCGNLIKSYTKFKRFGPDGHNPLDVERITNYEKLLMEMVHVQRRIEEVRGLLMYKASLKEISFLKNC